MKRRAYTHTHTHEHQKTKRSVQADESRGGERRSRNACSSQSANEVTEQNLHVRVCAAANNVREEEVAVAAVEGGVQTYGGAPSAAFALEGDKWTEQLS